MNTLTLLFAIGAAAFFVGAGAIVFATACVCVGVLWCIGTTITVIGVGIMVDFVERWLVRDGIIVPRLPWPYRWCRVWIGRNEYSRFRTVFSANERAVRLFARIFHLAPLVPG